MGKINSASKLKVAILELELKQSEEGELLKKQLLLAVEGIKPINLIKNSFKEVTESWNLKDNSFKTILGLLGKIALEVVTNAPIKKLLLSVTMNGIAKVVEKNPDAISSLGTGVLEMIKSKFGKREHLKRTKKSFVDSQEISTEPFV